MIFLVLFHCCKSLTRLLYQTGQLRATLEDIEDLKRQERSRQQRILKAKEALAAAERELDDLQPYEAPKAEMVGLFTLFSLVFAVIYFR